MWLHKALPQVLKMLALRIDSEQPVGVSTGIASLDDKLGGGWMRQQTSYLVGESGVGKSWLTSWWLLTAAGWLNKETRPLSGYMISGKATEHKEMIKDKEDKPPIVVFWSLEMSESLVCYRLLTQLAYKMREASIDSKRLLSGELTNDNMEVINQVWHQAASEYDNLFLEFDAKTLQQFEEVVADLSMRYDVCYIVVDYFRLIDIMGVDSIAEAQSLRSSGLRRLAKEYDCHVQAIFDITREGEKADKIQASHMKGGTAARYDSDLTLSIECEGEDRNEAHLRLNTLKVRLTPSFTMDLHIDRATGVVSRWGEGREDFDTEGGIGV